MFSDRVSLYNVGWLWAEDPPPSAFPVLGLSVLPPRWLGDSCVLARWLSYMCVPWPWLSYMCDHQEGSVTSVYLRLAQLHVCTTMVAQYNFYCDKICYLVTVLKTEHHNAIFPLCCQWHQREALGSSASSLGLKHRKDGTGAKSLRNYLKQENSLSVWREWARHTSV